jgi:hypothetical protein
MTSWIRLMSVGVGLALTSACTAFDRELPELVAPADARGEQDGDGDDAPGDAPLGCDLARPYGSPVLVEGVASAAEDASMRLSPDELSAYFFSARSGNLLLYTASRVSVISRFENVTVLANVNAGNQYNPTIAADGLTLFFASFRAGGAGDNDIFQATRGSTTADFTNPRLAANVNTAASEVQPYVTHDGTTMYFTRRVAFRSTVFRAIGSVSGGFTSPSAVTEIAGPTNDVDPVQSADGLTLFWGSDRPGGQGDLDVWQAQRTSVAMPFGALAPVASVNTAGLDAPSDVSEDGCRLYISSRRNGRTGIYVATRPR